VSSHAASSTARRRPRARTRRRRLSAVAVVAVLGVLCAAVVSGLGEQAVREITLPLKHDDIIRQQAADKGLDPALIAAVIYEESRFRDQT
jgi:soluble lytic murein transglycosylase